MVRPTDAVRETGFSLLFPEQSDIQGSASTTTTTTTTTGQNSSGTPRTVLNAIRFANQGSPIPPNTLLSGRVSPENASPVNFLPGGARGNFSPSGSEGSRFTFSSSPGLFDPPSSRRGGADSVNSHLNGDGQSLVCPQPPRMRAVTDSADLPMDQSVPQGGTPGSQHR